MAFETVRYPEWKQLFDRIQPLIESKTEFTYEELKILASIDIRSDRGRQQFYRFRKNALRAWQVWFECWPRKGYTVIPAAGHAEAAVKRVKAARRKVVMARAINGLAKIEQLTPEQLLLHSQTATLLEDLAQTFVHTGRKLAAAASKFRLDVSDEEVRLLGNDRILPVKLDKAG